VPADVAVVSCDDIPFAEFMTPPLTTVRVPLAETGRQAVELLLRSIAGEAVPERTPLLPVELIVRDSCGAPGPMPPTPPAHPAGPGGPARPARPADHVKEAQ
jgi:LacI family transcriptional regulator